jgi:CRISPR/Cas system Type II protein with McrA/HNH and RuvC-like nuclease domain
MDILRFAFDMGTNSIGWAVLKGSRNAKGEGERQGGSTRITATEAVGARIFSDGRNPKDGSSLAMMRREPRAARKRRDRYLRRQRKLMTLLSGNGWSSLILTNCAQRLWIKRSNHFISGACCSTSISGADFCPTARPTRRTRTTAC